MKLIITLTILLLSTTIMAEEREFRIDRFTDSVNGYAIAWGIPGKKLDFEKLDNVDPEDIENILDFSAVRNYVVDLETNQIIDIIQNDEFVTFNIAGRHVGNHYSLSLSKVNVEGMPNYGDVIAVIENYKWSNTVSKFLVIEHLDNNQIKTTSIDSAETFATLHKKLKESILDKNLDLFNNGVSELIDMKEVTIENLGQVMELHYDFTFPKSDKNSLSVFAKIRFKFIQGKIVPFILSVKQNQY